MGLKNSLMKKEDSLIKLIDAFTFVYIVSVFVFSGAFEHWVQSYSNIIAIFYLGLLFCYAIIHPKAVVSKFSLLYLPFLILCGVSYLWTWNDFRCIKVTIELGAMWALCTLMFNYLYQENKTEMLIKALYLGGVCIAIATVQYYGVPDYIKGFLAGERMGHVIINTNRMGMDCSYAAFIALYLCIYKKKWINIFPCILLFAVAVTSLSRKVVLMIVMGIFLLIFFSGKWKSKILAVVILAGLVAAFLYVPFLSSAKERFMEMLAYTDGQGDGSTNIRIELVKTGIKQFLQTPVLGIGLGSGRMLFARELNFNSYAHNNYVELLVDLGAVGCFLYYFHYLFPVGTFIRGVHKRNPECCLALTFILVALVLHIGCVEYHERFTIITVLMFYLIRCDVKKKHIPENTVIEKEEVDG